MARSEPPAGTIRFFVPGDPAQNTGGYRYVRKLVDALVEAGHPATVTGLDGRFPRPDTQATAALDGALCDLPDGALVVLDGLAMGGLPDVVARHSERLRILALVHHPLADETGLPAAEREWLFQSERRALAPVAGVITTSHETRHRLADFGVEPARLATAMPGVDRPDQGKPGQGDAVAGQGWHGPRPLWLCVAHLSPRKAQHHLIEALAGLADKPWHCALVGATGRDPAYADTVRAAIHAHGLNGRVTLAGEVDEATLATWYAQADGFVFPSVYEGYGMAIDEALAVGLPVISSDGGALSRLHQTPGVTLYPAGNVEALARALNGWLTSPDGRQSRQVAAAGVRFWSDTARDFLQGIAGLVTLSESSVFGVDWLRAREAADHRARAGALTTALVSWLDRRYASRKRDPLNDPLSLVDVGTGLGSNPAFLTARLTVPHRWTLIEPDPVLRHRAVERLQAMDVPVADVRQPLVTTNMAQVLASPIDLVTASALLDLVSRDWLSALAEAVSRRQAAVLAVISYAGHFELEPAHGADLNIRGWVNQHQHRDKGTGAALGPEATGTFAPLLEAKGYRVDVSASDWHLDASDAALIRPLLQGWAAAAEAEAPEAAEAIGRWHQARLAALDAGTLRVRVSHLDLLALPPDPDGAA